MKRSKVFWNVFFKKDRFGRSPFRALIFSLLIVFVSLYIPNFNGLKPIGFVFLAYSLVSPTFLYLKIRKR
jgi:uncharacterized membrane protein YhaH (DUF805 family)